VLIDNPIKKFFPAPAVVIILALAILDESARTNNNFRYRFLVGVRIHIFFSSAARSSRKFESHRWGYAFPSLQREGFS
jgi:hypothetical protein